MYLVSWYDYASNRYVGRWLFALEKAALHFISTQKNPSNWKIEKINK